MTTLTRTLPTVVLLLSSAVGAKSQIVDAPDAPEPRWSLSAGAAFRTMNVDFALKNPGPVPTDFLPEPTPDSGRGDVGLYRGGGGNITYDDGVVGRQTGSPSGALLPGAAYSVINASSQLKPTTRRSRTSTPLYQATFKTTSLSYDYANNFSPRDFTSSDRSPGTGPYFELRCTALRTKNVDANLILGYSWIYGNLGSGTEDLGIQNVTEQKTTISQTYVYDFDATQAGYKKGASTYPFVDNKGGIIFDPEAYNSNRVRRQPAAQAIAPSQGRNLRTTGELEQTYYATGSASIDVNLHEVIFAPELSFRVLRRLHAGVSAGPTLNIVDTQFKREASWFLVGTERAVVTSRGSARETTIQLGAAAQITVQFDLTDWLYLEAAGSYRYVPPFEVDNGPATASLDLSSFQGNAGVGFRF